jgi:homogentisate 1,2-dioxygenase
MKSWIHLSRGRVPRQAHVGLDELQGLKEDELGRQGFAGRVAEFYRKNEPTAWTRLEGSMQPWDIDGFKLQPSDYKEQGGKPLRLFYNDDVSIWISRRSHTTPYYVRNVTGDEIYFVHEGHGEFDTEFGPIPYEPGDYVVLPKGTTYRVVPKNDRNYFLLIETIGEIEFGTLPQLGRHAPFDPSVLFIPSPDPEAHEAAANQKTEWEVRIKHGDDYTSAFYPFDPLDVMGWKGDLFAFKINIRDYRPVTSDRIHLMPSAHCMFQAPGVLICNFLPRPAEGEREAERMPPYHRNIDYDEVIFAHGGRVLGTEIAPASIRLAPQGLHHGLPDSFIQASKKTWKQNEYYDWKLIGIDTVRPLKISPEIAHANRELDQILNAKLAE